MFAHFKRVNDESFMYLPHEICCRNNTYFEGIFKNYNHTILDLGNRYDYSPYYAEIHAFDNQPA
jgi:hypothetical protein